MRSDKTDVKIIRLNKDNYKDYPTQMYQLGEQIKEENILNNKTGQFFGTNEDAIKRYIELNTSEVFVAVNSNDEVVGYAFTNLNVPQNTNSDYTKYFHTTIDYKNNLANNFSDIKDYNRYVTKEYLRKIIIFDEKAREITEDPERNKNGFDIAEFIENQVENNTFYENNFLRRVINIEMSKEYAKMDKTTAFAEIYFYGINDVDRKLLEELYQETGYTVPLDTLISNYELFLKYQEPNFIEQPNFDLEPFFGVESKNALEINTCAVRSDYRSAGLAKAMLYETLKAMFAIYFENPENNEIYLVSTIHNSNTNSQEVLGAFGIDKYLYVERMKDQNRRVYIHKINKEDLQEFLYEIELEILMEYNYYSENFGIDMLAMKERIEQKIETYAKQLEQASNEKSINYYEAKIGHLTDLLNNEMFQNLQR